MSLPVIFAAVSAIAGASGAWMYQANKFERRLSEQRTEFLKRDFKALESAHAETIRLQATKDAAEARAAQRVAVARTDAERARAVADGLRGDLAAARLQLPDAACPAVRQHAATLGELFGECSAEVGRLAGQAQGHAIDTLKLLEAWPQYHLPASE